MSVLICSMKHFSSIEGELHMRVHNTESKTLSTLKKFNILTNDSITDLVDTWFSLNMTSYACRYRKNVLTEPQRRQTRGINLNPIAFYKAIKCLRYQIERKNIESFRTLSPKEEAAFDILVEMINEVADQIVRSIPEYEIHQWAID